MVNIEKTVLRDALGQLNWSSGIARPELSYTVSEVSSRISSATAADNRNHITYSDLSLASFQTDVGNTIVVKSYPGFITIPELDIFTLKLAAYLRL